MRYFYSEEATQTSQVKGVYLLNMQSQRACKKNDLTSIHVIEISRLATLD